MKTLALAGLLAAPAFAAQDLPDVLAFPPASGPLPLTLDQGERPDLASVVAVYARLTGQSVTYDKETEGYLRSMEVAPNAPETVAVGDVQTVFETLLAENDFVLTVEQASAPRLLSLVSLQTGERNTIRSKVPFLGIEHLDEMARHPAMLFTTVLSLPNTDVRQLANAMRAMITDANTMQMVPGGTSNSLVLTSFGPHLAGWVRMLRVVDASAMPGAPAGAPAGAVGAPRSAVDPALRFPVPSGPLVIPAAVRGDAPYSVKQLLDDFGRLTGIRFLHNEETSGYLESAAIQLTQELRAEPASAQFVVESLLAANDFVLTWLVQGPEPILQVTSLNTGHRNTVRSSAIYVPVEAVADMARHPALMITTVVHLPNTDVRQLSNSMRTMITDANTQQMLPAGNTNNVVLTGMAGEVAGLVRMLRVVDEHSVVHAPETVPAASQEEGR